MSAHDPPITEDIERDAVLRVVSAVLRHQPRPGVEFDSLTIEGRAPDTRVLARYREGRKTLAAELDIWKQFLTADPQEISVFVVELRDERF